LLGGVSVATFTVHPSTYIDACSQYPSMVVTTNVTSWWPQHAMDKSMSW